MDDLVTILVLLERLGVDRIMIDLLGISQATLRACLLDPLIISASTLWTIERRSMPLDDVISLNLA